MPNWVAILLAVYLYLHLLNQSLTKFPAQSLFIIIFVVPLLSFDAVYFLGLCEFLGIQMSLKIKEIIILMSHPEAI